MRRSVATTRKKQSFTIDELCKSAISTHQTISSFI
jgi:hypothetical protein